MLETAGLELAVLFNGEELYASRSDYPYSWNAPNAQAHIPLPPGAEGARWRWSSGCWTRRSPSSRPWPG